VDPGQAPEQPKVSKPEQPKVSRSEQPKVSRSEQPKASKPETNTVAITTRSLRREGHRRGGQRHAFEATTWPAGTFTAAQLEELLADPQIVVENAAK
jgi:hypothetical protein